MKKLSIIMISAMLALLLAALSPLTVFAQTVGNTNGKTKYISEVKIGMGEDGDEAAAALAGYTILSDKDGYVDLNNDAGGGFGSKGEKVVYLGYKTTYDAENAVTDLAVMNMMGGYSTKDYDALFDKYIKSQIYPLIDRMTAALVEYRVNYSSGSEANRVRAAFIREALNKFIDDDTGKGLGDLFLNRTKYEMGDEAYDALSDLQKQNTADIVTILSQANGIATLTIENLLARAADTSDDTWIDRFSCATYDDLIDELCDARGLTPTDAKRELSKLYDDGAKKIRAMWNGFYYVLSGYGDAVERIESFDIDEAKQRLEELKAFIEDFDESVNTREEFDRAREEIDDLMKKFNEFQSAMQIKTVYEYLDTIGYGDGTLIDFFMRRAQDIQIEELYPIVASFSAGQLAGLDFISILELVSIAIADGEEYNVSVLAEVQPASIYEGVDRDIFAKGGVALTSKAMQDNVTEQIIEEVDPGALLSIAFYLGCVFACGFALFGSVSVILGISALAKKLTMSGGFVEMEEFLELKSNILFCGKLALGCGLAMVILGALSLYLYYRDMAEYYDIEFTPIPRYMVDEKDITAYNAKGEKIFIKNQTAYYKIVECNRTDKDEMYSVLEKCSDINGDVGKQWLALYAVKNQAMQPILADSLLAVTGDDRLPANYTTGIHMFASSSVLNLNDSHYVWNGEAPQVYVYFRTDDKSGRSAAGSVFAGSRMALAGGLGMIVGALCGYAAISVIKRKKKNAEESAAA